MQHKLFKIWYYREKYIRKYKGHSEFSVYTETCWAYVDAITIQDAVLKIISNEGCINSSTVYNILYNFKVENNPLEI